MRDVLTFMTKTAKNQQFQSATIFEEENPENCQLVSVPPGDCQWCDFADRRVTRIPGGAAAILQREDGVRRRVWIDAKGKSRCKEESPRNLKGRFEWRIVIVPSDGEPSIPVSRWLPFKDVTVAMASVSDLWREFSLRYESRMVPNSYGLRRRSARRALVAKTVACESSSVHERDTIPCPPLDAATRCLLSE